MAGNRLDSIALFCDVLIPGGPGWAPASSALKTSTLVAALADDDRTWLRTHASRLVNIAPAGRPAAMSDLERQHQAPFARILNSLYRIYYTTPAAHESVKRLAESGPRDVSPFFDATLLRQVRDTQAGLRRL